MSKHPQPWPTRRVQYEETDHWGIELMVGDGSGYFIRWYSTINGRRSASAWGFPTRTLREAKKSYRMKLRELATEAAVHALIGGG